MAYFFPILPWVQMKEHQTKEEQKMSFKVHFHNDLSTGEMYDLTQTSDDIKDGDVFVCNQDKTVGFLMGTRPTLIRGEKGELDSLTPEGWDVYRTGKYKESFDWAIEYIDY